MGRNLHVFWEPCNAALDCLSAVFGGTYNPHEGLGHLNVISQYLDNMFDMLHHVQEDLQIKVHCNEPDCR
jgi:hypothetical protein